MAEAKKSKYEQKVLEKLDGKEFNDKLASRSYRKAKSTVEVQISLLKSKLVEKEVELENANESLEDEQFNRNFSLKEYDKQLEKVGSINDDIEQIKKTLENREELLKSWK